MDNPLENDVSLAAGHCVLGDPDTRLPLWPPIAHQATASGTVSPVEVTYAYERVDRQLFTQPPLPGLERWAPLLPPLAPGISMAEGGTALVPAPRTGRLGWAERRAAYQGRGRNPTWSHKDRFNLCSISVAVATGAAGVVLASSGNHGASAAAYAARAGLPRIVLVSPDTARSAELYTGLWGGGAGGAASGKPSSDSPDRRAARLPLRASRLGLRRLQDAGLRGLWAAWWTGAGCRCIPTS